MSREHLLELMDRLGTPPPLPLPLVFIHGHLLGVIIDSWTSSKGNY